MSLDTFHPFDFRLPAKHATAPQPPARVKARYRVRDGRIVIELPDQSIPGCLGLWLLLVVALIGLMIYAFIDSKFNWGPVALLGGIGGFILAALYGCAAPEQTTVEVDPTGLSIIQRGLIANSRRTIPVESVHNVALGEMVVLVNTADETESLGIGLSPEEREWLHHILRRVLTPASLRYES